MRNNPERSLDILIDARATQEGFKQHKHRGIGHYAVNLIRELRELPTPHRFTFLVDAYLPVDPLLIGAPLLSHRSYRLATRVSEILETQLSLPGTLRRHPFDLIHYLSQHDGAVYTPHPFLINIHDTIQQSAAELYSPLHKLKNAAARLIVQKVVDRAAAVLTISEYSRQEILRHYRVSPDKVSVTYLAAHSSFFQPVSARMKIRVKKTFGLPEEFLLYVGGIDPRKNVPTLLKALALLFEENPQCPPLAFAGKIDNQPEYMSLMETVHRLGLSHRVHFLGFVPEEMLPSLFAAARAFVFPSLVEGFGLPVIQAMAAGTPVIASRTSSIPEVAGDTAFYATMTSARDLADTIRHVLTHRKEAGKRVAEGKRRARRFSWKHTAEATVGMYEKIAGMNFRNKNPG